MSGLNFWIIDTETHGIKAGYNEITEIGIVRCSDRVQLWRQVKCLHPERANMDALAITNKTLADLEHGLEPIDAINECNKFFNEDGLTPAHRCIICHNASFDKRFLHALWAEYGESFPADLWLDTMSLTRAYAKQIGIKKPKVNLHASCDLLGVKKIAQAHNAKVDSRNTYLLWKALVEDKKVDYLPFIKTAAHVINPVSQDDEDGLDPSILDLDD